MTTTPLHESLQRDALTLFLGADLPRAVTGLPSRADLARGLAERHGLDAALSLAQVAQRVSRAGNRFDFTDYLRRELDTAGQPVPAFYRTLAAFAQAHPLPAITTAYDDSLERALRDAGVPFDRLARGSDVAFLRADRLALIKLYGDVQMPDTLVVTEDDHYGLWRDRDKEALLDEVKRALQRNTVLFLGYNLSDPDFHLLWREVLDKLGCFARTAYAVWPGLPESEAQMWRDRMIQTLEADPWGLISSNAPFIPQDTPSTPPIVVQSEPSALKTARRALEILEIQVAGFGALHIPAHLQIELEDKRREVAELEEKYRLATAGAISPLLQPIGKAEILTPETPDISPELYRRLQTTLLRCGPFRSDNALSPLFVDSRISQWRDLLPARDNPQERVEAVMEKLLERHNAPGDNALVLLLRVLRDRTSDGDACHAQLDALADELAARLSAP